MPKYIIYVDIELHHREKVEVEAADLHIAYDEAIDFVQTRFEAPPYMKSWTVEIGAHEHEEVE